MDKKPEEAEDGMVTVSSKGQISLPVALRRALGIKEGDRLVVKRHADGTITLRRQSVGSFRDLVGAWLEPGEDPVDVDAYLRDLRGPIED
jgi:AbrB family looped-hinge helix DNA binding protein